MRCAALDLVKASRYKQEPRSAAGDRQRGALNLDRIGYGIIGAGWILPNHAIGARYLRDRGVELTAIADVDEGRARRAAASTCSARNPWPWTSTTPTR